MSSKKFHYFNYTVRETFIHDLVTFWKTILSRRTLFAKPSPVDIYVDREMLIFGPLGTTILLSEDIVAKKEFGRRIR